MLTPNWSRLVGEIKIKYFIGYFAYFLHRLFVSLLSPVLTLISSASVHASINSSRRCRKLHRKFDLRRGQAEYDSAISSYAIFLREYSRRCVKSLPREEESAYRAPTAISSCAVVGKEAEKLVCYLRTTRIYKLIVPRSKCKFALRHLRQMQPWHTRQERKSRTRGAYTAYDAGRRSDRKMKYIRYPVGSPLWCNWMHFSGLQI